MRNPSDPRALPGADPHTGNRLVDPVTGYDTTGHDWGGIRELNTPFPRIAVIALLLTFLYSVITWILLPAWPTGNDYTRGLLGLDQGRMARDGYQAVDATRQGWLAGFSDPDFAALASDDLLMAQAMPAAARLFADNCAACHGDAGAGGPGFPALNDADWLWGGAPETVAETIALGINATDNSRFAEMAAFDWLEPAERQALVDHVVALPQGTAATDSPGAVLFADNCAACHGDGGTGGLMTGAPSLADGAVIYGQDAAAVRTTLRHGRRGVMPGWSGRLSGTEINLLALYVATLPEAAP
ncbi:cytochrome-c oxidase, cbb3-type subunit III [Phaeovulum sp. NW3]|uniref:cytochrome-c oxidase, cbb3-type subunit III n=1 Tax=Phaeovulum sp. NW3 TaxID=2934933 RepID=UPI0020205F9F|nr:cytochrome-c oxidase, cbb3-type subunit III [Phaeovulum sp. NW3]MCL7466557.1 cytochrome-c oxidase, cbb3-type subunit III [Phaeovulum sp. NW3]